MLKILGKSKVSQKSSTSIPKGVSDSLGLKEGADYIEWLWDEEQKLVVLKKIPFGEAENLRSREKCYISMDAGFSEDKRCRFWLYRQFSHTGITVNVIEINPSMAGSTTDDPTVSIVSQKLLSLPISVKEFYVTNLFAQITPNPTKLDLKQDCEENDRWIKEIANRSDLVILAWGTSQRHRRRFTQVKKLLGEMGKLEHAKVLSKSGGKPYHIGIRTQNLGLLGDELQSYEGEFS